MKKDKNILFSAKILINSRTEGVIYIFKPHPLFPDKKSPKKPPHYWFIIKYNTKNEKFYSSSIKYEKEVIFNDSLLTILFKTNYIKIKFKNKKDYIKIKKYLIKDLIASKHSFKECG